MQNQTPFTIYNASAGSGKTYTLVKNYLKVIFGSSSLLAFRTILALTFTNKAVGEMKARIIDTLKVFSQGTVLDGKNDMFNHLSKDLGIDPKALHHKSKTLLHTVVHNYAAFDVSTIDKFNHKLIRTFAHDLKLPVNFEVELDTKNMLGKAVDKLIDKAGTDKKLTKILVDFAIEKTDDDRSWDISYDFNSIAELLINENEIPYITRLADKTLDDFKTLKLQLLKSITTIETEVESIGNKALKIIEEQSIPFNHFNYSDLPNHFKKLKNKDLKGLKFDGRLQKNLDNESFFGGKATTDTKKAIASIIQELIALYASSKKIHDTNYGIYLMSKNGYKNITPLSVLGAINLTLDELKEDDGVLLISEFNAIINNEIREQPTPFIYERIGEKFKHYFIDEFQDTSVLQWHNLIPLIGNTISGENLKGITGSAMVVGDAKQAIYRWRGGRAEQFIELCSEANPFHVEKKVEHLPVNYRSFKSIVEFNNTFFEHIAGFAFSNEQHQTIYQNSAQELFFSDQGYVDIAFLDIEHDDKNELHCNQVFNTIETATLSGYALSDICIIVRKKKEGIAIAEYLSSKQMAIISSETLMLQNSPEVNFIVNVMALTLQPKNNELKIEVLRYLAEYQLHLKDKHEFFYDLVHKSISMFFEGLKVYGFDFNFKSVLQLPIYEAVETIIRAFQLHRSSNAYIQFFLDEVLDYSQKNNTGLSGFLDFWERKKETLSIVSPKGKNAVQIMTIHKSKGLEFPVVIFPYANQDIYFDMNPKIWFPVDKNNFNGFTHLYLNLNKELQDYNERGAEIYNQYRSELELDSINLLYVVLTRAVEQLYIISEYDVDSNLNEKLNTYSGLLMHYLKSENLWNAQKLHYTFGNPKKITNTTVSKQIIIEQSEFISTAKEAHNLNIVTSSGYLWDTFQEQAIEKGNLVHLIMSQIKTHSDVNFAFDYYLDLAQINSDQLEQLKPIISAIVDHEELRPYYSEGFAVYNERDIITKDGLILRPDRIVVNQKNEAIIIDYKTGLENAKHREQLYDYQLLLEAMDFVVTKKILIYINEAISLKVF